MEVLASRRDHRAAIAGAVAVLVVTVVYPFVADSTARPLAVFVLPPLLTAVLGGWRPTVLVGIAGLAIAIVVGVLGPLDGAALAARWSIVLVGTAMGAVGAAVRETQADRLAELDEAANLRAAFERALAPAPIPPGGFEAVSRYRPAESRMHLGGDFLEGISVAEGRLAVLIGDVCGHGPREAAFGSALRAGWKAIALGGDDDPTGWVASLDEAFFRDGRVDTYVTLCTGWIDRTIGVARLVSLGHPAPIALEVVPTELDVAAAPPLGLIDNRRWVATDHGWSGAPLLFYSDGLIENPRRGHRPDRWGTEGLLRWLAAHPDVGDLRQVADDLIAAAMEGRERRDDVALLLVGDADRDSAESAPRAVRSRPVTPGPADRQHLPGGRGRVRSPAPVSPRRARRTARSPSC
jgi:serine phosphatase RsbU (regulator of sigma subunit)